MRIGVFDGSYFYFGVIILVLLVFASSSYADTNVGGPIQTDSTWRLAGSPYIVNSNVTVYGTNGTDGITTLRIDPGVVVKFKAGTQLVVGSGSNPGGLIASGTSSSQITFTAVDTFQHWAYIYFTDSSVDWYCALQYCKITYGGSSTGSIYCNSSSPTIDHCTISYSKSVGIYLTSSSPNISNNTISKNETYGIQCGDIVSHPNICGNDISNNGSYPIRIYANSVGNICSGNTYTSNVNNYIQVLGETISLDATWRSQTIPYIITSNISICGRDGSDSVAVLTIEPGVKLHFNSGTSLQIGSPSSPYVGGIMAEGTANDSIIFTASDTIQGWNYILFHTYNVDSLSSLKYCKILYGNTGYGGIYCYYASAPSIDHCLISHNKYPGIYLVSSSPNILNSTISRNGTYGIQCGDAASHPNICGNDISNNGSYPIRIYANSVRNICSGNTYSGNVNNFVQVLGETVYLDAVWHNQTIPYLITSHIYVCGTDGSDNVTVLTIEPGSVLEFNPGTILQIGNTSSPYVGGLIAEGAINDSIVFTASDTIQGWGYILFHTYNVDSLSSLKYGKILYGNTGNGGLYCYYAPPPTIDHCLISHNKYQGIYLVSSSPNILNSTISRNGTYGIQCGDADSHPNICGNDISNNGSYPIRIYANSVRNICTDNTYSYNGNNYVQVLGETISLDATWHAQTIPYLITSHIYVCGIDGSDNVTVLTIEPSTLLKFNSGIALVVGKTSSPYFGGLIAVGTPSDSIIFTAADTLQPWGYLQFDTYSIDSLCVLKYCEVSHAGNQNIYCNSASPKIENCRISNVANYHGVYLKSSSSDIRNNLITANRNGIYCDLSNPLIRDNQIFGNKDYGIYNATSADTVQADSNYWGDISGPYDPDNTGSCKIDYNPSGKGDKVTDCIRYRPWSQGGSQTITVTSPRGGEMWCGGKPYTIQWSSSNIDTVKIEYSTNDGANWINIVSKTPSDGNHQWTVPDTISSTNCWMRVCDIDDVPCDQSDSAFTISQVPPSPTIVWPANDATNEKIDPTYFDWNASTGATSYKLQVDDNFNFSSPEYDSSGIIATSQNVYKLSLGKTYYWRVGSGNTCGQGNWSPVWHFTTSTSMQTIFHEDWEEGIGNWSVSNGVWEVGMPRSGPWAAYSGESCAATVLGGAYPKNVNSRLMSPESSSIHLPKLSSGESLYLRFWHWFDISEYYSYDKGYVQISVNGGDWKDIPGSNPFSGSSSVWSPVEVDLSMFADSTIRIGFYFYSDDYSEGSGWYVDDIVIIRSVRTFKNPEDWEEGIDDWLVDNGVWEVGTPTSGPGIAHSGQICAATVLGGAYPKNVNTRLISPNIRLPKLSGGESFRLRFWHWFDISEYYSYDKGYVQISVNGGDWKDIPGSNPFSGSSSVWTPVDVSLSPYVDSTVRIGFYFYSDDFSEGSGWYIDDIQIIGMPETTITVLEPNGGEIWSAGSTDTITWTSSNIDTVEIEYTTDGGSNWIPIEPKTPSNGIHIWTVPNTPSGNCLVRICDKDDFPCDQSDSFFTITVENITVLSPKGGEKWCAGDIDTIKWSSTGIDSVKILYSTNGGSSWTDVIQKWPSNKGYPWTVPQTLSNNCLVKICNLDDSPCDQSDSFFSITTESLTLVSPNGGQSWLVGSSQDITWQSACIENVHISYSINGGYNWSDIASQTPSDGSYTWTVSDTPSDSCLVKICDVDGMPCDTSNNYFTITRKTLSLTLPTGGENWCANDTQQIIWASAYIDSVRIQYSTNGGLNWNTVVYCTTNAGHYSWKVPNVSSALCRVKICDCDLNPCDESDSNFTILTIPSAPALVSPSNGATDVSVDSTHFVWNASSGASTYRLQVDDDSTFSGSECDTSGISSTSCNVYGLSCGVKHYWRVKAVNPCGESGWSVIRHFTAIMSNITITSPNGGEIWSVGGVDTIKWISSCVPNVGIYYSTNGGNIWTQIVQTISNNGQYIWTVPSVSSDSCKVKVMDALDGIPYDESDGSFTIMLPLATLKEYHPHPGEWITYDSCLTLDFSRRMDPTTFDTSNISIRGVNGLIYRWSQATSDSQSFHICPDSGFYSLDTVAVKLKGTIKDSFGRCWDVNGDDKEDCDSTEEVKFYVYPLGDYNYDKLVNGEDVADFSNAWNEQKISKEIGPAVGTPPHLLPKPDNKVDFEDLVIFVWMWNWSHQNIYISPPVEPEEGNGNSENLIAIIPDSSIAENEKKEFGLILKDTKDVMAINIFVEYDPNKLRIESADAGPLFSSDDAPTLFLKSIDNERGTAEIASSRLKGNTGEVKGAELAAKMRIRALAALNSELITIHYKTWDFQAKPLYSGHSVFELNSPLSPPKNFELFQNYPNPFNPQTSISYVLPIGSPVKIMIYNITGQNVKTILDEYQSPGNKVTYWDGTDDNGKEVASGIYFCTLKAEEFSRTIKIILLR